MQYNPLKPELVTALNLESHGYSHPEAVLLALESAQHELCQEFGLTPDAIFSLEDNILQILSRPQTNIVMSVQDSNLILNNLLQYVNTGVHPDRIVHFNFSSGDKMVGISTYANLSIQHGSFNIPCFSLATLYLDTHPILSVVFALIH